MENNGGVKSREMMDGPSANAFAIGFSNPWKVDAICEPSSVCKISGVSSAEASLVRFCPHRFLQLLHLLVKCAAVFRADVQRNCFDNFGHRPNNWRQ